MIPERVRRVGKRQDKLLVKCGYDETAERENTAEEGPVQRERDRDSEGKVRRRRNDTD